MSPLPPPRDLGDIATGLAKVADSLEEFSALLATSPPASLEDVAARLGAILRTHRSLVLALRDALVVQSRADARKKRSIASKLTRARNESGRSR